MKMTWTRLRVLLLLAAPDTDLLMSDVGRIVQAGVGPLLHQLEKEGLVALTQEISPVRTYCALTAAGRAELTAALGYLALLNRDIEQLITEARRQP